MTKKEFDDEDIRAFLRENKPEPKPGTRDLEERILMATVLKPSALQTLLREIRTRSLTLGMSFALVVAALLFFFQPSWPGTTERSQPQNLVALTEQEQHEIAEFMEGAWQQSVGDLPYDDLMDEDSL